MAHHVTIRASHLITLESNFILYNFLLSIMYGHCFNSQQLVANLFIMLTEPIHPTTHTFGTAQM